MEFGPNRLNKLGIEEAEDLKKKFEVAGAKVELK